MEESRLPVAVVNSAAHPGSPTAGIQETIAQLPEAGGVVFIPRGTYLVRRSILLRSGVTLQGEGVATALVRPAPVVFDLTASSPANKMEAGLSNVEGLKPGDEIWFMDSTQGGWWSRHIGIETIQRDKVQGTLIAGEAKRTYLPEANAWGGNFFLMLFIPETSSVTIDSLLIDGGPHRYDAGRMADFTCAAVHGVNAESLRVQNVTVRRWPGDGIGLQNGAGIVTGCVVEDCLGNGFHPGTGIGQSIWTNNISRRNGWDGLYFCQQVRNAVVANNVFADNKRNGIGGLSDPDAYNVVTGNVLSRNGHCGIEAPYSLYNVITNNVIYDNSRAQPGLFPGIALDRHVGNVVTGNLCFDTQKPPTQTVGIEAVESLGENLIAQNLTPPYPPAPGIALPRGEVRRTAVPPKLDGRLDEAIWKTADVLTINRFLANASSADVQAQVTFLRDDRNLYVGVRCAEPLADRIKDTIRKRGGDVWTENDIELFIDPGTKSGRCYQFVINSLGTIFELKYEGMKGGPWDSRGEAAAWKGDDFWSAEIAIPLEAFCVKEWDSGQEWKANIGRVRTTCFPNEFTSWSPTFGSFAVFRRFGTLVAK